MSNGYYQHVEGRELKFIQRVRARASTYLPVVTVRNGKGNKDRVTVLPHSLVQELLGHKDVKTTMIYTHVMNRPGLAVSSPVNSLLLS